MLKLLHNLSSKFRHKRFLVDLQYLRDLKTTYIMFENCPVAGKASCLCEQSQQVKTICKLMVCQKSYLAREPAATYVFITLHVDVTAVFISSPCCFSLVRKR